MAHLRKLEFLVLLLIIVIWYDRRKMYALCMEQIP